MKMKDKRDDMKVTRLVPNVDVFERKEEFVVMADLPGVNDKGLEVTLDSDNLTISGKTDEDAHAAYKYERSFTLTDRVDRSGIKAAIKDGVLTLSFPYAEEAKAKKIPVTYN
jgi:HSP20 family protein